MEVWTALKTTYGGIDRPCGGRKIKRNHGGNYYENNLSAYGSNLNLAQMSRRCPTAKPLETAVLTDYQLLFRGGHGNAVATVEPRKGSEVPALLWEIEPDDEKSLDCYEGYPFLYRKETVTVENKGEEVTAMMYVMNSGRPISTPNCYYYSTILEGFNDCRFDKELLKQAVADSDSQK